jgi:hypothetical protein
MKRAAVLPIESKTKGNWSQQYDAGDQRACLVLKPRRWVSYGAASSNRQEQGAQLPKVCYPSLDQLAGRESAMPPLAAGSGSTREGGFAAPVTVGKKGSPSHALPFHA